MTIAELLERRAHSIPDAIAIVSGKRRLTYSELNSRANQLARYLIGRGIGAEKIVAAALPRSELMIVALFAILKAGAAYLPIDLDYPSERIKLMLDDANPAAIITTEVAIRCLPGTPSIPKHLLSDQELKRELIGYSGADLTNDGGPGATLPANAAYVMYTSGSTGKPKGVVVPHAGIANMARIYSSTSNVFRAVFGSSREKRLRALHMVSWGFDAAWGAILWMLNGHEMHIISELDRKDPEAVVAYVNSNNIDCLDCTPEYIRHLMEIGLLQENQWRPTLIIVGGEAMTRSLWSDLRSVRGAEVYNTYGPTECTVDSIDCALSVSAEPRIGQPVTNVDAYVLDVTLHQVRTGEIGELYIAGAGLARGYLGKPGMTAERFVACPFGDLGIRMYRTGDLVRKCQDGNFEFMGRIDDQVKIRGFRIELGEIESVLSQHPLVDRAVATVHADSSENKTLTAYVVPASEQVPTDAVLRAYAEAALPGYMIPSSFMIVNDFPLTPNGKVDRNGLPVPDVSSTPRGRRPRTHDEKVICKLFAEVLRLSDVGADENFFVLGGHSLLAARLVSKIRSQFGVTMSLRSLFEAPTPAGLAKLLITGNIADPLEGLFPLRRNGDRIPLFCIHPGGGLSWCYSALLPKISENSPIYSIQARGLHPGEELPLSIEQMACDYMDLIRSVQSHGPYQLAGWCFGGVVAHEIAVHLQENREDVALLALVDSVPANTRAADTPEELREMLDGHQLLADVLGGFDIEFDKLKDESLDELTFSEIMQRGGNALAMLGDYAVLSLMDIVRNNIWLSMNFVPKIFDGDILFFKSQKSELGSHRWQPYVSGKIVTYEIPGGHEDMTRSAAVSIIGEEISSWLI
jgi:amino acid adenylation domain-containing protein